MINKLLCYFLGCKMKSKFEYHPNIYAEILEKVTYIGRCKRCGRLVNKVLYDNKKDG